MRLGPWIGRLSTSSSERSGPDVARLVEVLDRYEVEYLVVGGVAACAYGVPLTPIIRPTR